jgi:tight adherence protein B
MIGILVLVTAIAAWLQLRGPRADGRRVRRSLGVPAKTVSRGNGRAGFRFRRLQPRSRTESLSLVVLVQQIAALLRGGRGSSRLWEELWLVHGARPLADSGRRPTSEQGTAVLSREALMVLNAARAASTVGNSPAEAIRSTAARAYPRRGSSERRVWMEMAACLEVAESSGCPLAGLLSRFAAQLEAEEDAEAARQTALAGPKATVRLLSWLPVFGLVLGMALGVEPVGILLDNIMGIATFIAGLLLTVAGRLWSSRLVASAAGGS